MAKTKSAAKGGSGLLEKIVDRTRRRVEGLKKEFPLDRLREFPLHGREPLDFAAAIGGKAPRLIAEVKFASPTEGLLHWVPSSDAAVRIAGSYLAAGASAVSVLTEPEFFSGFPQFLSAVRRAHPQAPLLMKDFFIDPYQLELARAHGADAVLLVTALLGEAFPEMLRRTRALGLTPLVEVHTREELSAARAAGAGVIGVNARDLKALKADLAGALFVAESGVATRADLSELSACGYSAFLVGTHLMRCPDPGLALRELLGA